MHSVRDKLAVLNAKCEWEQKLALLTAPAVEITELLRARTEMDYTEIFVKLGEEWDKLAALNA